MTEDNVPANAIGDGDEPDESGDSEPAGDRDPAEGYRQLREEIRQRGAAVLSGYPTLAVVGGDADPPVALDDSVEMTPAMRTVAAEALRGSMAASSAGELAVDDGIPALDSTAPVGSRETPAGQGTPAVAVAVPVPDRPEETADGPGLALVAAWDSGAAVGDRTIDRMELLADYAGAVLSARQVAESLERHRREIDRQEEMVEVYDTILRHDLGNELQIITGFSEAVQPRIDDQDALEYVQRIHRTAGEAADLVAAASETVGTLEEGSDPAATALEPVLSSAVRASETAHESLETSYAPGEFELAVLADDLLETVFHTILENAAVHADAPVSVDIYREDAPDRAVVVGFRDDGEGVPPAVRDSLFEMGKQGPASDRPGFGLGLARAIVHSYSGSIELAVDSPGGADFRVRLPRPDE